MFHAMTRRAGLRGVLLAALAVPAFALAAPAPIEVHDEGRDGVLLTNLDGLDGANVPDRIARDPLGNRPLARSASGRRGEQFAPLVLAAANANGLPAALLQAVIEVESDFNPAAVSPKGALGLMQLMPETARLLRVRDARDPASNIDGGARYLKELLGRFGNDLALALAAYNAGPMAVQRSGAIPRYAETQRYVPKVIARYHVLQSSGGL
jgi:soluble lytic murein transglycosylase-like protein